MARRALEQIAAHADRGLRLTVNLSGRTRSDERLLEDLERELDDFGAGFGSFYSLKHLPFDYLKIDETVLSATV